MTLKAKAMLVGGAALLIVGLIVSTELCIPAWYRWGMRVKFCPDGEVRPVARLSAWGLKRGLPGVVELAADAEYVLEGSEYRKTAPLRRIQPALALVDKTGRETSLEPRKDWSGETMRRGEVTLPEVPDGDYLLRARIATPAGEAVAEAPLALYAPARVHVLTDRPLYEPGNTVRFRAVVLRAADLSPIDARPGVWKVIDPEGEVLLEEKAPAGEWGVVSGSFPLDSAAASGEWRVSWSSGEASGDTTFSVRPFTLPRFNVTASADKPFYGPGGQPKVKGQVTYSSGAPVAGAEVSLEWSSSGAWPLPTEWLESGMPTSARTDASGAFTVQLPRIPADLQGQVTLRAQLSAVDPAGDRVEGSASVLLSQDAIQVAAVTELDGGLVAGFNNRVFLRVSSADGVPLPGAELKVRRAWEPESASLTATTDEDGVAALQLDPGPPVNVVIPPMPVRLPPAPQPVALSTAEELLTGREPDLRERRAMESWLPSLQPCARFADGDLLEVMMQVRESGAIADLEAGSTPLARCFEDALRGRSLPPGQERVLKLHYAVADPDTARLEVEAFSSSESDDGEGWDHVWQERARDARLCLPREAPEVQLPRFATFRVRKGSATPALTWARDPSGGRLAPEVLECVAARFARVELPAPAKTDVLGVLRLNVVPSERVQQARPQPTVMLGYELLVSASAGTEAIGSTKLRVRPGSIPPMRLRATPVLAKGGDQVTFEFLRGPNYVGELPKKAWLRLGKRSLEADVDAKARRAVFTLPPDADGWGELDACGARAVIFIQPTKRLEVAVAPGAPHYAPGQLATLNLTTTIGGVGARAAVGLFGVDETLGQLVALPGPDALSKLAPQASTNGAAFDVLEAQALALGRIRGRNAAAATVLRVGAVPQVEAVETPASAHGQTPFDPVAELTDRFYVVLAELHRQARTWEEKAPAGEQMQPRTLAKLWEQALAACEARNEPVRDAYGRRLKLSQLPQDLLALTEPRAVVIEGTRLPEDIENWSAWVAREKP